jgi:hypothetical protein
LGGGRNLDFDAETTIELAQTEIIQNKLEQLLKYAQSKNVKNSASMEWNYGVGTVKVHCLAIV